MEPELSVIDLLRDWLFECKIENTAWVDSVNGNASIKGFGWAIDSNGPDLTFTNRLDLNIAKLTLADPDSLDQIKLRISEIEGGVMNYLIEHVDDDGWKTWKPPKDKV